MWQVACPVSPLEPFSQIAFRIRILTTTHTASETDGHHVSGSCDPRNRSSSLIGGMLLMNPSDSPSISCHEVRGRLQMGSDTLVDVRTT
jgi:hypothetical protein